MHRRVFVSFTHLQHSESGTQSPMSSLFKRNPQQDQDDNDDNDAPIDPDLRLRTVRTAASTIAESIRSELRAERRSARKKRSLFFRKAKRPKTADSTVSDATTSGQQIPGLRRNVYVNTPLSAMEVDQHGQPLVRYPRNKVRTSSESALPLTLTLTLTSPLPGYTLLTFLPKNLFEQFHR